MEKSAKVTILGALGLVCVGSLTVGAICDPVMAAGRHHRRHDRMQGTNSAKRPVIPYGYSFYPEEIEGGVSGNLPFNNQIRKSKDPLNANGGGG